MIEQHRQQYLDALGIECYIPRWVLPNAALSEPLDEALFDEYQAAVVANGSVENESAANELAANESIAQKTVTQEVVAQESTATAALEQPIAKKPAEKINIADDSVKTRHAKLAQAEQNAKLAPAAQKLLRFSLSIWRISDELMVVDSRQLRLALPTDSLLNNILAALGYRLPQVPRAETLRWPALDNQPRNPSEIDEARDMVQAYLAAQAEKRPVKHVLLMGAIAARFALPTHCWPEDDDQRALLGKSFTVDGCAHIVVPSLAAMLQTPALKAITWQAIQPLRLSV